MRYIPWMDIGLYVVMLNVILLKFIRAIPLLMVLFCGFGFTYYMLLQYQPVFQTPFEGILRTAFSLFDLGYENRLYSPPTGVMYYPVIYFVFILTQIVLTILITNMLIGELIPSELPYIIHMIYQFRFGRGRNPNIENAGTASTKQDVI